MGIPLDIFAFAGQSNMVGQGNVALAPVPASATVYKMDFVTGTIVPAVEPVHTPGMQSLGSMLCAFGIRWNALAARKVLVLNCAFVGPQIDAALSAGQLSWKAYGILANGTCETISRAMDVARAAGYEPRLCGMVWLQGEAEGVKLVTNPGTFVPNDYLVGHLQMIDYFRARYPDLPFLRIRIGTGGVYEAGFAQIRAQQDMLQVLDPRFQIIFAGATTFAARGLMNADGYHWGQIALNECGDTTASNIFNSGIIAG